MNMNKNDSNLNSNDSNELYITHLKLIKTEDNLFSPRKQIKTYNIIHYI
jgi:hypothetical protein